MNSRILFNGVRCKLVQAKRGPLSLATCKTTNILLSFTLVCSLLLVFLLKTSLQLPLMPPDFASNETTSITTLTNGGPTSTSGCQLTYLDENFQPFSLDNNAAAGTGTGAGANSGVAAIASNQTPSSAYMAKYISSGPLQLQQINQNNVSTFRDLNSPQSAYLRLIQPTSPLTTTNIGLDCQHITAEQLHDKFNRIKSWGLRVSMLNVKDSTLITLGNLPQGFHELKKLSISNTSIDLEVLKEGSESLDQLTTLEIINEKISNIPQNFFQEMQSLRELRLENDGIASLDGDAFHNLDDSLEVLVLRNNRFNRFPMAVKNLAQLAVLDLSDNEIVIDTQENDLPEKLEPLLNLRELLMNRINCTCEFSSSPFFEWIARTHISGVRCFAPEQLKSQEVIVFERDEFCTRTSSAPTTLKVGSLTLWLCQLVSLAFTIRCLFFLQ